MAQAKNGDTIRVHYTGKMEDGTVFDTSANRDPLQFTIGDGRIIKGFEEGVIGMKPGESKTLEIPADMAYGPHHEEMILTVSKEQFPETIVPEIGQRLQTRLATGQTVVVTVTGIADMEVTLDANHPLAGKDLIFEVELVEIV